MCDYCSCRSMPVIEELGADHEDLLARAGQVHKLIAAGDIAAARAALGELLARLRVHTDVEEASVFAGLRAAGEMLDHVDALAGDHRDVWSAVGSLDTDDPGWGAAVDQLLYELHDHIGRGEYDLFPATLIAIAPGDWDDIEAAAAKVRSHAG